MELDITWAGPPIDDLHALKRMPDDLKKLRKSVNGLTHAVVPFAGALESSGTIVANLKRRRGDTTPQFDVHSPVAFSQLFLGVREQPGC